MFLSKPILVVVLSIVTVSVIATPHALSHALHHRAIAARVASPLSANATIPPFPKRQNNQRCRHRTASSSSLPKPSQPSSTNVQPHHTTAQQQSTTVKPPSPTSVDQQPAPTTTSPSGNNDNFYSGSHSGDGTFYATGLGACGITSSDSDHIAAISHLLFDTIPGYNLINPNKNPVCGKKAKVTYQGKSVVVSVVDRCQGCEIFDLDLSPSAFQELADFSIGRFKMQWEWVN